jgi:LacI family transcriptional regulator
MTTLKEIADQLGISIATASRAINHKPGVRSDMRTRVLSTAEEMGYSPNSAARALATSSLRTIGFLSLDRDLPLAYDPFYLYVLRGVEEELARLGFFVVVSTVDPSLFGTPLELPILREKRVDGIILPSSFFPTVFPTKLKKMKVPLVLIDNLIYDPPIDSVLVDDENAGYTATTHLLQHGYRRLVMMSGPKIWPSNRLRAAGFRRAMEAAGFQAEIIYLPDTTIETGSQAMCRILDEYPATRAVFAVNDAMAIGALRATQERGLRIPEDLALISVDDIELACHVSIPLTTMHIHKRRLGVLAARRLVEIIRNPSEEPVTILVPAELVIRGSCGCPG